MSVFNYQPPKILHAHTDQSRPLDGDGTLAEVGFGDESIDQDGEATGVGFLHDKQAVSCHFRRGGADGICRPHDG